MIKKKKVLVSGNFNILHPGHLRLLRFAKECGDHLIVAVNSDKIAGKNAHVPEKLRIEGVRSNNWVDEVILVNQSIEKVIKKIRPEIVVKGKEYENSNNPEEKVLQSYGGRLIFSSGEIVFSSYDLIQKEFKGTKISSIRLPKNYLKRHSISQTKLNTLLKKTSKLNVVVVGDLIIDKYVSCQPLGMSQEDTSLVVTPFDNKLFVGGAGIVAIHAAGLGAKVNFFSISGKDSYNKFANKQLREHKVKSKIFIDDSRPTTNKTRYRSNEKTLLRVSNLHQVSISKLLQKKILNSVKKIIRKTDLLVFSDFNYGCLPQPLVNQITSLCKKSGTMIVADSQSSSQTGNICRFKGMDLITPTEREARISTRNYEDGLIVLASHLRKESSAKNSFIKLGAEGLLIHTDKKNHKIHTDKIAALNSSPIDFVGAGDSMLISSAMVMAVGGSIWDAALIGSIASAIQVSRFGNSPIKLNDLLREIKQ